MAYNLKEVVKKKVRFTSGHRMCAGCGAPTTVRAILSALKDEDDAVITSATGCLEVSSCIYPYTSWKNSSFIHSAFENAGATCSGAEAAYNALKRRGKVTKTTKSTKMSMKIVAENYLEYSKNQHENITFFLSNKKGNKVNKKSGIDVVNQQVSPI